jgi:SAM-dependent methyltransferase
MSVEGQPRQATEKFRERIYARYASKRHEQLVPATVAGLESRGPHVRTMIRRHFPEDRDALVLDLGCGHGTIVEFARRAGYRRVRGVDRSAEQVREARRLGIQGVEEGDLFETVMRESSDSIDAVICFDVIEHLTRDELLDLVDDVFRILKPGGRLIIHSPNGESPFFGRIRYGDLTHELAFTRDSIGQLLFACGFAKVSCYEDAPIVHGIRSAARWVVWRLVRSLLRLWLAAETGRLGEQSIFSQNFLVVADKPPTALTAS